MPTELELLCGKYNIGIRSELTSDNPNMSDMPPESAHWKVALTRTVNGKKRKLTTFFSQGPAVWREPTAADVLSCLISDARCGEMSFEEFVSEFGYDIDSRKAENTWKACRKTTPKVIKFVGEERSQFEMAEH